MRFFAADGSNIGEGRDRRPRSQELYWAQDVLFAGQVRNMAIQTDDQQQTQLELEGLRRTLQWTEIQQEQLLNRLDLLRLENARLQDRVEELVRQVEGLKQQQPLF